MAGRLRARAVDTDRLALYDEVAQQAADALIARYSTSFGLATRLLPAAQRAHIRTVYALVRLADEVVDGASVAAGAGTQARRLLDDLEAQTEAAMASGYSTNVLVHAFAATARHVGFGTELTAPLFAAMRMDLDVTEHDEASLRRYVYGSAEVIGLMCLRVFLLDEPAARRQARYEELAPGAQGLGAAFQKVNFLRDLAEDYETLGRRYLDVDPAHLTEEAKAAVLADIAADLHVAALALPRLPAPARRAVGVAYALFAELAARLAATPADEVLRTRVRVPGPVKARLAARALLRGGGA
ncbi:squalene/phytoene synthase family protein [Actinotalea sp.]|uniref:phytoene/squalene synthase family protein n=1 Tax=Actinotalea sp. TaxID=1872145 RepID=UPI002BEE9366|nr:squalene/phytoene synthase family protein [Actinotalea sp.]HRA51163.1 squalene/phytoene synthase family protein [Actinotalea sp.]